MYVCRKFLRRRYVLKQPLPRALHVIFSETTKKVYVGTVHALGVSLSRKKKERNAEKTLGGGMSCLRLHQSFISLIMMPSAQWVARTPSLFIPDRFYGNEGSREIQILKHNQVLFYQHTMRQRLDIEI